MGIGKPAPMLDALARVTGTVPYGANLELPEMLVVKVLRSPLPHAVLRRLDAREAEALPGVVSVLTGADFDAPGKPNLVSGVFIKDQPVVALDRVRYVGEPVALVAAESEAIAEQALERIEVDYEELPAVYDPEAGMEAEAPRLHDDYPDNCFVHARLYHGDLPAGFAAADLIVEEVYTSPVAQQSSLEPHVTAAQWTGGKLTVWTASQAPYLVRKVLAEMLGISVEQVRVIVPPLGGSYGGKGHVRVEPMVAALAWKVGGRPVKLILSRAEEFSTVTKHAAKISIRTGVKKDGTFTARQVRVYWGAGAYADASPALIRSSLVRCVGPYRFPAVQVDAYGVYTNLPPAAAFRGAMTSQTAWAYESHADTIAHRLSCDPLELRLRNLVRDGDTYATGEELHDVHFVECLKTAAEGLGWGSPVDTPVETKPHCRRGRGLAVMLKSTPATSKSQCRLVLESTGQVTLYTSTVEMGQGAHTALAQIAADALDISLDLVGVVGPDTALTPFDSTTSASRSTNMMGNAVTTACRELAAKLKGAAAPLFEVEPEQVDLAGGELYPANEPGLRVSFAEVLQRNGLSELEAWGEIATQGSLDPETGQGVGSLHYHQGAGACEVEVDTQTGKVTVLRYFASSFAGRIVNPVLAKLQNDGNVIYGMGPALMEEMVFSDGQPNNVNFSEYQIPSFLDAPVELKSYSIEAEGSDFHGIGEMTLPPVAPAIANAIFAAVGVRVRDLPVTPEKVYKGLVHGTE